MLPLLKSDFIKLSRTRSTYGLIAFSVALAGIYAFWAMGFRAEQAVLMTDHTYLQRIAIEGVGVLALIGAFVPVLLVTHEYRYNTIMYTLTSSNRRYKVLLSKLIITTGFALAFTIFVGLLAPTLARIGIALQGADLVSQQFYYSDFIWRVLFYGWGYAMAGMLIAILVRNQIAAIMALLLLPGLVEQLLGLLLKANAIYLPFTALNAVIQHIPKLSHSDGALVFSIYLVIAGAVATILFHKRDAN